MVIPDEPTDGTIRGTHAMRPEASTIFDGRVAEEPMELA